jgi:hypothetical protein
MPTPVADCHRDGNAERRACERVDVLGGLIHEYRRAA